MNGALDDDGWILELNRTFQILANRSSGWRSLQWQLVRSIRFSFVAGSQQGSSSSPVIRSLPNSFYVRFQRASIGDGTAKLYRFSIVRPPSLPCPPQKAVEGGYLRRGRHQYVKSSVDSSSHLTQSSPKSFDYPNDGRTRIVDAFRLRWLVSLSELPSSVARLAPFTIDGRDSSKPFHS